MEWGIVRMRVGLSYDLLRFSLLFRDLSGFRFSTPVGIQICAPLFTLSHTRVHVFGRCLRARTQKTHRFTTFAVCAYTFRSPLRARIDVCLHIAGIATGVDLLCAREGKNNNVE